VFGERVEHVVEEIDVGIDGDRTAVERKAQVDIRLFGRALDDRAASVQFSNPLFAVLAPLGAASLGA
jgi:hypothetical protein